MIVCPLPILTSKPLPLQLHKGPIIQLCLWTFALKVKHELRKHSIWRSFLGYWSLYFKLPFIMLLWLGAFISSVTDKTQTKFPRVSCDHILKTLRTVTTFWKLYKCTDSTHSCYLIFVLQFENQHSVVLVAIFSLNTAHHQLFNSPASKPG